jgi:hypothetical protein
MRLNKDDSELTSDVTANGSEYLLECCRRKGLWLWAQIDLELESVA